ncbi:hypothetical protein [Bradyrhizobium cytisi]|uniref:Uncharacterized protein n=1 Tax=Bradyrhizobium cytisi TaxID=515489 RepID=A0A5S4X1J3_9BRAD|nr:hypothetical protein [Bradyrhizobium cytisi]TYL87784.1 hypothetical protein FXB38_03120 [Bradyrhizobium cytisi]
MSNVIVLATRTASRAAAALPPDNIAELEPTPRRRAQEPQTETAKNKQLREQRRTAWNAANARTEYWKARLKMQDAIYIVRDRGLPEGQLHAEVNFEDWTPLSASVWEATAKQFLTPAPTLDAVEWKRKKFAAGEHKHSGLTSEHIELVIAQDLAFLASHPMRRVREEREV